MNEDEILAVIFGTTMVTVGFAIAVIMYAQQCLEARETNLPPSNISTVMV